MQRSGSPSCGHDQARNGLQELSWTVQRRELKLLIRDFPYACRGRNPQQSFAHCGDRDIRQRAQVHIRIRGRRSPCRRQACAQDQPTCARTERPHGSPLKIFDTGPCHSWMSNVPKPDLDADNQRIFLNFLPCPAEMPGLGSAHVPAADPYNYEEPGAPRHDPCANHPSAMSLVSAPGAGQRVVRQSIPVNLKTRMGIAA